MEELEELNLNVKQVPAQIDGSFDIWKAKAKKIVAEYTSVAITEDNYKDAKASARELGRYAVSVGERKKEAVDIAEIPINAFKTRCDALAKVFTDGKETILHVTDTYDVKMREQKLQKMQEYINDSIIKFSLSPSYAKKVILKPAYGNVSSTLVSSKEDIEKQCIALKKKQDKETFLLTEGNATIEAVNATIEQKINFDMFKPEFDAAMSSEADDNGWFSSQIRARGKKISDAENAIRKKAEEDALEKARKIAEAEVEKKEAEKAAKEADAAEKAKQIAKKESIEAVISPSEQVHRISTATTTIKVAHGCNVPDDDLLASPEPVRTESKWVMTISLTGTSSNLKQIGAELEALCIKHNCIYAVDEKNSKRIAVAK